MVVMVFFHVYIINVIALLLYVHYNNGPGEMVVPTRNAASGTNNHQLPESQVQQPGSEFLHHMYLPRIEGIRVRQIGRAHV